MFMCAHSGVGIKQRLYRHLLQFVTTFVYRYDTVMASKLRMTEKPLGKPYSPFSDKKALFYSDCSLKYKNWLSVFIQPKNSFSPVYSHNIHPKGGEEMV